MKPLALVVDDEEQMLLIVTFALETQGFETVTAGDTASAWRILSTQNVDIVILDIMLPRGSGLDLTRRIRARSTHPPILLLSALDGEHNRIAGLEAGADDYVTKPFSPRELALRAEAIYRRTSVPPSQNEHFEQLLATPNGVFWNRQLLDLSSTEEQILKVLIRSAPDPVPRAQILNEVWGTTWASGASDMIKTAIYRLRRKLAAQGVDPNMIHTAAGGYQLQG